MSIFNNVTQRKIIIVMQRYNSNDDILLAKNNRLLVFVKPVRLIVHFPIKIYLTYAYFQRCNSTTGDDHSYATML